MATENLWAIVVTASVAATKPSSFYSLSRAHAHSPHGRTDFIIPPVVYAAAPSRRHTVFRRPTTLPFINGNPLDEMQFVFMLNCTVFIY